MRVNEVVGVEMKDSPMMQRFIAIGKIVKVEKRYRTTLYTVEFFCEEGKQHIVRPHEIVPVS